MLPPKEYMKDTKNSTQKNSKAVLDKLLQTEQLLTELAFGFIDIHPSEIDQAIEKGLLELAQFYSADRTYIYLFENGRKDLVRTHQLNQKDISEKIRRHEQVDKEDFRWLIAALLDKQIINIPDPKKLPANANTFRLIMEVEKIKSAILHPLLHKDVILGFIGVDFVAERRDFESHHCELLAKASRIFAAALHFKQKAHSEIVLEQKFKNLFSEIEDVVFISSPDGKFLEINSAGVKLFGYDSADEIKSIDINRDLYYNTKDRDKFKKALKVRGHVTNYELNLKRKDGKIVIVIETATVIRNDRGEIIAYQGILHDITQRRLLEQQLSQAQKLESIGLLAGGVAHDFNNILTTISGYAELIRMDLDAKHPHYENINNIINGGKRAEELIRNLLAFGRKQMIEPVILDLNKVINNLHSMLFRMVGEDVRLELRLKEDLSHIKADNAQLQQILVNLVVNASHAIKERKDTSQKGLIRILTDEVEINEGLEGMDTPDGETKCVRITVEDNGIGMNEETQEKIFEPFFSTKKEGLGTGLGLSTVYGIVKQNNGSIRVESETDIGTVIEVYWPASEEKHLTEIRMETEIQFQPAGETVLYVEDDFHVRDLVSTALKSLGYNVIEAENGEKALDKVVSSEAIHKLDVLITDIVMPEMGGEELAENIHQLNPKIKIILCSGYTDSQVTESERFTKDGYLFLAKPFSIKQLDKTIRMALT
jgi:two-component system cell cycle sensor histidine kinase/response regulator CckA